MPETIAPVRTPTIAPEIAPERRMHPDELCPSQKDRLVRRIETEIGR